MHPTPSDSSPITLDPDDWAQLRAQGHRMLDDMFDFLEQLRAQPVWQRMPATVREAFHQPVPRDGTELGEVHARFLRDILPYGGGNVHPGFMGWVQGGGTPVGMLAEMLAGGLDANCGGRDHAAIEVEWQVVRWMRELFGFPEGASGLFVTGSSTANLLALLVARTAATGETSRATGIVGDGTGRDALVAYASASAHECIARAMAATGLGTAALRVIGTNARHEIDVAALERAITDDRRAGRRPFLIVATAGTVDVGAIDDLPALADLACREAMWLHVDGALGALGIMSPDIAPRLAGIERADSIAFDFHKWAQVPYDAGFLLVRDGELHRATFASAATYLRRAPRGLAAGGIWPTDLGLDLSRGFRALKTWFTLQVYGTDRLGRMMSHTCALARHLRDRVEREPALELLAPVTLDIVCFRYRPTEAPLDDIDALNADIVMALQESGVAAPSTTVVDGRLAIRAAIVNHRTEVRDVEALLDAVIALGDARVRARGADAGRT